MACLGSQCVVRNQALIHDQNLCISIPSLKSSVSLPKRKICASLTLSNQSLAKSPSRRDEDNDTKLGNGVNELCNGFDSSLLDNWMRNSVSDIVKNLNQSPLLVQIYENSNGSTDLKAEQAEPDRWPDVMSRRPSPDGVILIKELEEKEDLAELRDAEELEDGTKAWGVLIQGKKDKQCGSACYLLKTSSVGIGGGVGIFCTHFCLMRVNNFRESAFSQLSNCWLLR